MDAGQRQCCCPEIEAGPVAALTAPGVEPAPAPTIAVPSRPGVVAAYSDFRGSIYRFPMGDGVILNLMHTVAGVGAFLRVYIATPQQDLIPGKSMCCLATMCRRQAPCGAAICTIARSTTSPCEGEADCAGWCAL